MVEISEELRDKLMLMFAQEPVGAGSDAKTDASSGKRAQRKGLGQREGGGLNAGPTATRGGFARRMETGKEAGLLGQKPRQRGGQEIAASVTCTTTRKGTQLRVYRLVPLLAIVVDSEGH